MIRTDGRTDRQTFAFIELRWSSINTLGIPQELPKEKHAFKIEKLCEMEGLGYLSTSRPNRRGGGQP